MLSLSEGKCLNLVGKGKRVTSIFLHWKGAAGATGMNGDVGCFPSLVM